MAHTPGQWWYDEHTECIGSPAGWIASLAYHGERKSDVEFGKQIEDAHLIAAAPNLLAELERIVKMDTGELGHEYETKDWATARALIAQARGEEVT